MKLKRTVIIDKKKAGVLFDYCADQARQTSIVFTTIESGLVMYVEGAQYVINSILDGGCKTGRDEAEARQYLRSLL